MKPRILVVEDEPELVLGLQLDLRRQGYEPQISSDGVEALALATSRPWDLILLDVMLPGLDGYDVCTGIRRAGITTPIILLTARAEEAEKVLGLDAGADDYLTKPFGLHELRARIRAHLRRGTAAPARSRCIGDAEVDFDRAEIRRGDQVVALTAQEVRLLEVFLEHRGRLLSREQIIDAAWGHGTAITDRVVDTHVFNLRQKIEPNPAEPRFLMAQRGLGYRLEL